MRPWPATWRGGFGAFVPMLDFELHMVAQLLVECAGTKRLLMFHLLDGFSLCHFASAIPTLHIANEAISAEVCRRRPGSIRPYLERAGLSTVEAVVLRDGHDGYPLIAIVGRTQTAARCTFA